MKNFYFVSLFAIRYSLFAIRYSLFAIPIIAFSQCPTTPIVLTSQAEVDAFSTNYPNCTQLLNTLSISGDDIVDLTLLSLISEGKNLYIQNNPLLTNLNGLQNYRLTESFDSSALVVENNALLTSIVALTDFNINNLFYGFRIANNPSLLNLDGLESFNEVDVSQIINNDGLTNLNGLNNITCVCDGFLEISDNDNLINLVGLGSITNMELRVINNVNLQSLSGLSSFSSGYVMVQGNTALLNLSGLESLTSLYGINISDNPVLSNIDSINSNAGLIDYIDVTVQNNPNLSSCNSGFVCEALENCPGVGFCNIVIENNAPDCENISQVAYACGLLPFNDECVAALEVTINESIEAYNSFGTMSPQTPSCNDDEERQDVWFRFNSGDVSAVDISVNGNYNLQLREGDCTTLTQVPNACGSFVLNDISVAINTDYYVQVWSIGEPRGAGPFFELLVQDATLSVAENDFESVSIFPNPVNDILNFKSFKTIDELQVYNLLGQNMMNVIPNSSDTKLDMSGLSSGMYILKVHIGNETASYKVVKE